MHLWTLEYTISELAFASVRNSSYENVFLLQLLFHANQTHLHVKGIARGLVLKQRHTREWPIDAILNRLRANCNVMSRLRRLTDLKGP